MSQVYDDIVIGAGSSGAVLAARLSEDPARRVLLLDGGPDYQGDSIPAAILNGANPVMAGYNWGYEAFVGQSGRTVEYLRGKLTGGTSAINSCIALRGASADFDEWTRTGLADWSWDDVLPYYLKLEDDPEGNAEHHNRGGPVAIRRLPFGELRRIQSAFRESCLAAGFPEVDDLNSPELDPRGSIGLIPQNVLHGERQSTAMAYLKGARSRPNLTVLGDRLVDRVRIVNGAAVGVDVIHDGRQERHDGRRITISAGVFGSPAILMRSGVGPSEHLAEMGIPVNSALEGVGSNLVDHAASAIALKPIPGLCNSSDPTQQLILRYTSQGSADVNDMQLMMASQFDSGGWAPTGDPDGALMPMLIPLLQKPRSRGSMRLSGLDPDAHPVIRMDLLSDPEDRTRMIEAMRLSAALVSGPEFKDIVLGTVGFPMDEVDSDQAVSDYLDETVSICFHAVGTAKMGPDNDNMAVLDNQFRVRGIDNLRVVDAAAMPAIVRANTNLTCIMLGERAADLYKAEDRSATTK